MSHGDYTVWYALRITGKEMMEEVTEHLSMNGYTFDTNGKDTIFVFHEEIEYVETILNDRGASYEVL